MLELIENIILLKCPRCRSGNLFVKKNYLSWKNILLMNDECPKCRIVFELENGFWWGTGYVNYALSIIIFSVFFTLWFSVSGFKTDDVHIFMGLGFGSLLIIILQPWIMRVGRSLYIHLFVSYEGNFNNKSEYK